MHQLGLKNLFFFFLCGYSAVTSYIFKEVEERYQLQANDVIIIGKENGKSVVMFPTNLDVAMSRSGMVDDFVCNVRDMDLIGH